MVKAIFGKLFPIFFLVGFSLFLLLSHKNGVLDKELYNQCLDESWYDGWEPAFNLICFIGGGAYYSYYLPRLFVVLLLGSSFYVLARRFQPLTATFFLLLFSFMLLGGYRQGIALVFLFYSVYFFDRKRFQLSFSALVVATLFHYSSIFFGLYYLYSYFFGTAATSSKTFRLLVPVVIFMAFASLIEIGVFNFFLHLLLPGEVASRYSGMLGWSQVDYNYFIAGQLWYVLNYGIIAFTLLKRRTLNIKEAVLYWISTLVIVLVFTTNNFVVARFSLFAKPFEFFFFFGASNLLKAFLFFMALGRFFIAFYHYFIVQDNLMFFWE